MTVWAVVLPPIAQQRGGVMGKEGGGDDREGPRKEVKVLAEVEESRRGPNTKADGQLAGQKLDRHVSRLTYHVPTIDKRTGGSRCDNCSRS